MTDYKGKGVAFLRRKGTTETREVVDERDGSVGGFQREHWDGRQDAHVIAKTVDLRSGVQGGDE